mmetsp:Transcript_25054/g.59129  ORF Transcript_25054/g.59129 Transcript_25054/m.59129 type:complete len:89 (+) Transcript_25054:136-402(+)
MVDEVHHLLFFPSNHLFCPILSTKSGTSLLKGRPATSYSVFPPLFAPNGTAYCVSSKKEERNHVIEYAESVTIIISLMIRAVIFTAST